MAATKLSIHDLLKMKREGEKVSWLTAYDYPTARFAEEAGLDMLLVGDSLGMCVYGYEGTVPVTMDQCIVHCQAVRRGAPHTFVIGDMPFMSYQKSDEDAVANAGRFLKEAMVDAIKLEGGRRVITRIRAILDAGIVVCGHIGLTPQSSGQLGGHKAQGRTAESAQALIEDALAIEEAGAQLLLLEAVPPEVAGFIARRLAIPVYSIGAGPECDGQLLIVSDMIGQFQAFTPKFVKKYADVAGVVTAAMKAYVAGREEGRLPRRRALLPHAGGRAAEVGGRSRRGTRNERPRGGCAGASRPTRGRLEGDQPLPPRSVEPADRTACWTSSSATAGPRRSTGRREEAGKLENLLARLDEERSPYRKDLDWLHGAARPRGVRAAGGVLRRCAAARPARPRAAPPPAHGPRP